MTGQLLSRLTHSASALLTAACSSAAFNPNPGRPAAPTATALQPLDASASRRATSSRASADITVLPVALKKPVTFNVVGIGTTKLSLSATSVQGTPAIPPHDSKARRTASSTLSWAKGKNSAPPGPSATALCFRAGVYTFSRRTLPTSRVSGTFLATKGMLAAANLSDDMTIGGEGDGGGAIAAVAAGTGVGAAAGGAAAAADGAGLGTLVGAATFDGADVSSLVK